MLDLSRRSLLALGAGAATVSALSMACSLATAQERVPLKVVVPFPAGGIADTAARLVGQSMATTLNRPVIIDNRPGAAGLIGTRAVQAAAPDGNTLLFQYIGLVGLPFTQKGANYDTLKDFVPVGMACDGPGFIVIHSSVPARSVEELVRYSKSQPAALEAATSGPGGGSQMWTEWFAKATGAKLLPVPYKGGSEMTIALTTGEAKVMISNLTEPLNQQIKQGKLRLLAVTSDQPSALAPGLPTVSQTIPGFDVASWWGFFAPAGTPPAIVDAQSAAIRKATEDASLRDKLLAMYLEPRYRGPAESVAAVQSTQAFWKKVVADLSITPQ